MVYFTEVYSQFLDGITSCSLSELTDEELRDELKNLLVNSICDFKFPKIKLDYSYNEDNDYFFVENITQKEIKVLVAFMRAQWLSYQITKESNWTNEYFDNNARTFSKGALMLQLNKAYSTARSEAENLERNYYRVNSSGRPAVGDIRW